MMMHQMMAAARMANPQLAQTPQMGGALPSFGQAAPQAAPGGQQTMAGMGIPPALLKLLGQRGQGSMQQQPQPMPMAPNPAAFGAISPGLAATLMNLNTKVGGR